MCECTRVWGVYVCVDTGVVVFVWVGGCVWACVCVGGCVLGVWGAGTGTHMAGCVRKRRRGVDTTTVCYCRWTPSNTIRYVLWSGDTEGNVYLSE